MFLAWFKRSNFIKYIDFHNTVWLNLHNWVRNIWILKWQKFKEEIIWVRKKTKGFYFKIILKQSKIFRIKFRKSVKQPMPQLENISWRGKNILSGVQTSVGEGQKYTIYNKINNNSKNFRGQGCCQGSFAPWPPLVVDLKTTFLLIHRKISLEISLVGKRIL